MNWGIRFAVIGAILLGIVWLLWDQSKDLMTDDTPELAQSDAATTPSDISNPPNTIIRDDASNMAGSRSSDPDGNTDVSADSDQNIDAKAKPAFDLPEPPTSLSDSDDAVKTVADDIAPESSVWLKPVEQIRKWVLLVSQAARGNTLYRHRPFKLELEQFIVEERDERYFISYDNFERYDTVVRKLINIPADKLVAYYRSWYPLLDEAYSELGLPGSFAEQVNQVIDRILEVEVLVPPIELKKPTSVTYKYLDPELESASQIHKWLWRMGPENTRQIKAFAYRVKRALERTE